MNRHGVGAYAVVEAAIAGVACDESGTDIGCGKVRTGAASCREGRRARWRAFSRNRIGFSGRTAHAMRDDETGALLS